jgi:CBS domain-containing protein
MAWTVGEVMSREVVMVERDTPFKVCAELMHIHQISGLPVVSGQRLVGIVTEADLMRSVEAGATSGPQLAGDVMTQRVVTIGRGATVAAAARLMSEKHVKRLPVVDAAKRVVGIVSRGDVLRGFLRSDESIRREVAHGILDEMPLLGRGRVQVEVRDGVVRLHGEVANSNLTGLLVRLISGVPGVVGVENRLREDAPDALSEPRAASSGSAARA